MDNASLIGSSTVTVFWLLVAVAAVALITKRIRLPYTVALVLAGLAIALMPGVPKMVLTPELILAVFLPVLVFEAAYNLDMAHLRENVRTISALAIPGVLLTAAIIAALIHYVSDFEWPVAFLFGAIVAATDPVSVVSTFKQLGAPARLRVIIEGESLFNDGTALVLFRVILGVVLAGEFNVVTSVGQFVFVILGGLALGVAAGYLVSKLMTRFDDYLIETVLTVIVAYGTYFLAEELHVSGVIAVVGAGLLVGNYGTNVSFSPTSQIAVGLSWEFFGFLANSLIFLLVGLEVQETELAGAGGLIIVGIAAVLLSRAVVIAAVSWVLRILRMDRPLSWGWQTVLTWGGLRGALSLAMALSLPLAEGGNPFPHRAQILAMTFGVILFTLVVQGLTLQPLLQRLGLGRQDQAQREYERTQAELRAIRAAQAALDRQARRGVLLPAIAEQLRGEYREREQRLLAHLEDIHLSDHVIGDQQLRAGHRQLLAIEKGTLRQLYTEGAIDEETWRELSADLDVRLAHLDDDAAPVAAEGTSVSEAAGLRAPEAPRSR